MVTGSRSQRKCHAPYRMVRRTLLAAVGESDGRVGFIPSYSRECDFEAGVGVAPKKWDARQPVFCVDQPADAGKFLRRQNADSSREFGASDLPAHSAGRNLDLGIIADALALPQFAVRHKVELVVVFGKPDGRVHSDAALPKSGEADVTLAVNFCGDGSHEDIVNSGRPFSGRERLPRKKPK